VKLSRKQDFIHTSVLKSHISTTTITTTTKYYYYAYIENHSYDDIVPRNNKNETESELSLCSLSLLDATTSRTLFCVFHKLYYSIIKHFLSKIVLIQAFRPYENGKIRYNTIFSYV